MRLLVIGGSGLLGSHLLIQARQAGHQAVGTYRTHPGPGLVPLDLADTAAAARLLEAQRPDAVVHSAGWTWVDGCEDNPARAMAENAEQPATLARLCAERGLHFSYVSTSYIFDGLAGPYDEAATPRPINVYARSKWEGEQRTQAACGGAALLPRVICVYGEEAQQKNFACQVGRAMREGRAMKLPSDQCGNPSYAGDIAAWLVPLIAQRARGAWHLGGPRPDCTRPQWAEMLVAAFREAGVVARPGFALESVPTTELKQRAPRPLKAGMISRRPEASAFRHTPLPLVVRRIVEQTPGS
jgi:dTDP-4-dehydrorhamnose reductase